MQTAHVEFTDGVVRWYSDGGYESRSSFEGVASLHVLGRDTVYIHAMHGKITRQGMAEAAKLLYEAGFRKVVAERNGEIIVRSIEEYM